MWTIDGRKDRRRTKTDQKSSPEKSSKLKKGSIIIATIYMSLHNYGLDCGDILESKQVIHFIVFYYYAGKKSMKTRKVDVEEELYDLESRRITSEIRAWESKQFYYENKIVQEKEIHELNKTLILKQIENFLP
ncbi:hypothetical protein DPMN_154921 [Dreissena polymorpha]|uniref:Uncharacterized protein n=1 Tax=Dreissena polymorpha TaxID=45954 RepID=A0A9D4JAF0_DREPO|nr:hypothetical protein DPMN_154921 [Dreissena polymorpha]